MGEEIIIRNCAPTLAGLKTGEIFVCKYESGKALKEWIRDLNRRLSHKGLRVIPLKKDGARALIYVYRPAKLERDMSRAEVADLLKKHGYVHTMPSQCIVRLIDRLQTGKEFPHEIGLFLGYPPEDVKGFIELGGRASKCVGNWCVYGDVEQAKKTFSLYAQCKDTYMRQFKKGSTIDRLTVSG